MKPIEKMSKARAGLILDQPFFGSLAMRLDLREDPTCETVWTNGRVLGFNPEFIGGLTLDETKGVIAHDVMHLANCHHTRRKGRDPGEWNKAGDFAINPLIEDSKMVLPSCRLRDPGLDGKSTEEIYRILTDRPDPEGEPKDSGGGQGSDDSSGGGGTDQNSQDDQNGQDPNSNQNDPSDSGSGGDPGGCGEIRDFPAEDGGPASSSEIAQQEQDWKIAAVQAATQAKSRGMLPAGIARMVQEIANPKLDWRTVLRRFIEMSAKNDYTWSQPNRRFVHMGLFLPSLRSEELKEIVIAVDTSCSIGQDELDSFAAEINGILEEFETVATVIYCDAAVAGVEVFDRETLPVKLQLVGGGGTSFIPPFEWIEENGAEPTCLVYLTDMECSRFPAEPGFPVLWVSTEADYETPPFGEVAELAA
jgi:predicted metal-dependent peptidase